MLTYETKKVGIEMMYYRHGEYHRLDGAALLWANRERFRFRYGELYYPKIKHAKT